MMTPLLFLTQAALAQQIADPELNAQLFRPSIDAERLLWTDDTARAQDRQATGRMLLSYTADPLVYTYTDGERVEIVSDVVQTNLLGAYTLGRLRLGADLPVYLLANSRAGSETGLGDVAADAKLSVLRREEAPIGFSLGGRVALPTATVETALGSSALAWEAQAIVDQQVGPVLLALNVGTRGLPEATLGDVTWNDQLLVRGGGAYDISDMLGVSAELSSSLTYSAIGESEGSPLEGLLGAWYRPGRGDVVLRGGVGTGLTTGVGAPTLRTLLAVAYEPPTGTDLDGDRIVDSRDACPTEPEDVDSYRDDDGCPDPTAVVVRVIDSRDGSVVTAPITATIDGNEARLDGTPVSSGGHDLHVEAEGFTAASLRIQVPGGASYDVEVSLDAILPGRLIVRVHDPDGNPIEGASWALDGQEQGTIGSQAARLELQPGSYRVAAAAEGYLKSSKITNIRSEIDATVEIELRPTTIQVTRDRIDLGGKIYFETGKAIIKPESFGLLSDVAAVMTEYPEIRRLRIEGHTDARGSAQANQELSEARAASVATFLSDQGISAERLDSIGYGESRPVDRRQTAYAYEKNRRVDFFVEEWVEITREVPADEAPPAGEPDDTPDAEQ